jgi:hypothetical protein
MLYAQLAIHNVKKIVVTQDKELSLPDGGNFHVQKLLATISSGEVVELQFFGIDDLPIEVSVMQPPLEDIIDQLEELQHG